MALVEQGKTHPLPVLPQPPPGKAGQLSKEVISTHYGFISIYSFSNKVGFSKYSKYNICACQFKKDTHINTEKVYSVLENISW